MNFVSDFIYGDFVIVNELCIFFWGENVFLFFIFLFRIGLVVSVVFFLNNLYFCYKSFNSIGEYRFGYKIMFYRDLLLFVFNRGFYMDLYILWDI